MWCSYCKSNGDRKHTYLTCVRKDLKCDYCRSIGLRGGGHTKDQCYKNPDNVCELCGKMGHKRDFCVCDVCEGRGHIREECSKREPYFSGLKYYNDSVNVECSYCGEMGHTEISKDGCPYLPANQRCLHCRNSDGEFMKGHTIENCREMALRSRYIPSSALVVEDKWSSLRIS